jgi:antitoxin VapB
MALNIRNTQAETLAAEVARLTGETKTEAVIRALKARLKSLQAKRRPSLADELDEIAKHCASLPVQDPRSADEILGYGDEGLPG